MSLAYKTLASISISFILTGVSIFLTFLLFASTNPSLLSKALLWNATLAVYLTETGWLSSCINCELLSLGYILFYTSVFGIIGYFFISFGFISLKDLTKKRNLTLTTS